MKEEYLRYTMKNQSKQKIMTFGDFVAGVYGVWGRRKAKGVVKLAIKMHLIEFRGADRFVFS
jgi:hypothetical protein